MSKRGSQDSKPVLGSSVLNHAIEDYKAGIAKFAAMFSGNYGVRVIFRGTQAMTDGKTIVVPEISLLERKNMSEAEVREALDVLSCTRGFVYHEGAHIIFTTFTNITDNLIRKYGPKFQLFLNALEDGRIERKLCRVYAGAKPTLTFLHNFVLDEVVESFKKRKATNEKTDSFVQLLYGVILQTSILGERQHKLWKKLDYKPRKTCRLYAKKMLRAVTSDSTEACALIAERIWKEIQEDEKNPNRQRERDPSAPPPKQKSKGGSDDESGGRSGDEGESESEASEEKRGSKSKKSSREEEPDDRDDESSDDGDGDDSDSGSGRDDSSDSEDDESSEQSGSGDSEDEDDSWDKDDQRVANDDSEESVQRGSDDGEEDDDSESSSRRKSQPQTDDESDDGAEDDEDGDDEGTIGSGASAGSRDDSESSDSDEDGDESEQDRYGIIGQNAQEGPAEKPYEASDALTNVVSSAAGLADKDTYRVYSTEHDYIGPPPPGVLLPASQQREWVKKLDDLTRSVYGPLRRNLENTLKAQAHVHHIRGLDSGELDQDNLYKLAASHKVKSPHLKAQARHVFSQRVEALSLKETAVMVTVDRSGSMNGAKTALAIQCADILGNALSGVGIPFAVQTWSTGYGSHHTPTTEERLIYSRFSELIIYICKTFEQSWESARPNLVAMGADQNWNVDGESVAYAVKTILQRKERRKVVFVLSDGQPNGPTYDNNAMLREHVHDVVKKARAAGVEIHGIGIRDTSVIQYYKPHAIVVNNLTELPVLLVKQLKQLLGLQIR